MILMESTLAISFSFDQMNRSFLLVIDAKKNPQTDSHQLGDLPSLQVTT
jgi:hypothetical protein